MSDGRVVSDYFVGVRNDVALVAAFTANDCLVLVRQWKQGAGEITLELPGGIVGHEDAAAAAARELLEETGYTCVSLVPLLVGPIDPTKETLRMHLFTGDVHDLAAPHPDPNEVVQVALVPVSKLRTAIAAGEITTPSTVTGIYVALDATGRLTCSPPELTL